VQDEGDPIATKLNALPKHVASRTRSGELAWNGASVLGGGDELVARIRELKAGGGDGELQVHGSAGLLQTLFAHELVDELRLLTVPVVLGTGKRVFAGAAPAALRLAESRSTGTGVVLAVYEHAGRPGYGAFGLDTQEASAG
jgi:dihydrofolate reductase